MIELPLEFLKSGNLEELFVESRKLQLPAIYISMQEISSYYSCHLVWEIESHLKLFYFHFLH